MIWTDMRGFTVLTQLSVLTLSCKISLWKSLFMKWSIQFLYYKSFHNFLLVLALLSRAIQKESNLYPNGNSSRNCSFMFLSIPPILSFFTILVVTRLHSCLSMTCLERFGCASCHPEVGQNYLHHMLLVVALLIMKWKIEIAILPALLKSWI